MVRMHGGGCNKSKPLSLATVDVRVYPSCHAESCHVTILFDLYEYTLSTIHP